MTAATVGVRFLEIPDGHLVYPRESLFAANADPIVVQQYPTQVALPYRPVVFTSAGRHVLLDTGAGPLGPDTGRLQHNLRAAGISPATVAVVILSHAHADHIGGLAGEDGLSAFPNARIIISRREYDFWRTGSIRNRLGAGDVYGNPQIETIIATWIDKYLPPVREQIEFVEGETEVEPGVFVVPSPGHTPGHLSVLITSEPGSLLYTGDAFMLPEHIPHPDWVSAFDLEPQATVATRRALLDRAAAENLHLIHYHFGHAGRVRRRGMSFVWDEG